MFLPCPIEMKMRQLSSRIFPPFINMGNLGVVHVIIALTPYALFVAIDNAELYAVSVVNVNAFRAALRDVIAQCD